jgi:hypothetical protein
MNFGLQRRDFVLEHAQLLVVLLAMIWPAMSLPYLTTRHAHEGNPKKPHLDSVVRLSRLRYSRRR